MSIDTENKYLWDRFCQLGEMIGDGLHNEPDGKWIRKEYNRLRKILLPKDKTDKEYTKLKNKNLDILMAELIKNKPCHCGGILKQYRSGSKVAYCQTCNARYKAK